MELAILVTLLALGIALIIIEIIFIPGTTLIGVLGFLCLVAGIYASFSTYGQRTGYMVLSISVLFLIASIFYIFKAKTWEKMALNKTIDTRVNQKENLNLSIGTVAIAVSNLRPSGTIEFENQQIEVQTQGEFVESKSSVKVIEINRNEIIVEKLKEK